jgi:hypothetical protein
VQTDKKAQLKQECKILEQEISESQGGLQVTSQKDYAE